MNTEWMWGAVMILLGIGSLPVFLSAFPWDAPCEYGPCVGRVLPIVSGANILLGVIFLALLSTNRRTPT